ncbi:MAG: tRNA 2-selenouridine(34) synthase MnmH [Gallionella sp.]|nr:tRNA 2-selenouridine(34) synthase MnmH [Gallionella sp.]
MLFKTATLPQLGEFDEIIDVRSPSEFADDHIPGAINCPVLNDEERARVGTLYTQTSPFEARKLGAVLVARNIAAHIENRLSAHPKSWRPLIYCWRGGQRSGAMSIILNQVGWAAHKLEGGYKQYRRDVIRQLEALPGTFKFEVLCGSTGSGKSRFLKALEETEHQVLDLETLAQHRGSVLGNLPHAPQPSQKGFESRLLHQLARLDPARPVYIEAESRKIGRLAVPDTLLQAMHTGHCRRLETTVPVRVGALLEDYPHFTENRELLETQLDLLQPFHPRTTLESWRESIARGDFYTLVESLLITHYDPAYFRALEKNYADLADAETLSLADLTPAALRERAAQLPR